MQLNVAKEVAAMQRLPMQVLPSPEQQSASVAHASPTCEQVTMSGGTHIGPEPVSRQIEDHVYNFYGWDPHWSGGYFPMESGLATPFVAPLYKKTRVPGRADAQSKEGDPHLRSIATITGYQIHASDGEIGHVEDFLVDDAGWNIRYIKVDTRNWWPGKRVLISPYSVREIDWSGRLMHISVNRQRVKDSPPYDPCITIDGAYEEKFLTYYGIRWVAA